MEAKLILENGVIFKGKAFGYLQESVGEVVFTTGMTGYQEVLTDSSFYGQIVTMTYPLIGNYGINLDDMESNKPKVKGFVVKEKCDYPNNFRCEISLDDYLKQNKIIGIEEIDTRALTKFLRDNGDMKGIIVLEDNSLEEVKEKLDRFSNKEAVKNVSTNKRYEIKGECKNIAIIDFGIKNSIINAFVEKGCSLNVFPYNTKAEEILNFNPDLVFLSNGPGNPNDLVLEIEEVKKLIGVKPLVGIGLGHEILALSLGGKVEKLKFGHRGSNYPVRNLENGKLEITSQNNGFIVTKLPQNIKVTHLNINDKTIEGFKDEENKIYSVQFYPKSLKDAKDIFDEFLSYAL